MTSPAPPGAWAGALRDLESLAAVRDAGLAVVARDLRDGSGLELGADRVFPSASLIKVPLMVTVLRQAEAAAIDLATPIRLDAVTPVGGSGVLAALSDVTTVTVRDLLTLSITVSDNLATNLLIGALGPDGMQLVTQTAAAVGLPATRLRRTMMDADARRRGVENVTTATDMAHLMERIATRAGLFATPESYRLTERALLGQQLNDRLPRHLPGRFRLAHKTGELAGIRHDAGYVLDEHGPVLVVVVLSRTAEVDAGRVDDVGGDPDLVAEAGRVVYRAAGL